MKIPADFAMGLGATRLGDDLDDAAAGVAVLRFKAARLDLYFLDEGLVDAAAKRAVGACPHSQASEGRVVDGNAVRDIRILESAGAGNRWVVAAGLNAVDRARAQVKEVGNTALDRDILKKSIRNICRDSRGGGVHRNSGGADFRSLGNLARFEDDFDAGGLINLNFGALYVGDLEACLLHLDGVNTRTQRREKKRPLVGRRLRKAADRPCNGDLGVWHDGL